MCEREGDIRRGYYGERAASKAQHSTSQPPPQQDETTTTRTQKSEASPARGPPRHPGPAKPQSSISAGPSIWAPATVAAMISAKTPPCLSHMAFCHGASTGTTLVVIPKRWMRAPKCFENSVPMSCTTWSGGPAQLNQHLIIAMATMKEAQLMNLIQA